MWETKLDHFRIFKKKLSAEEDVNGAAWMKEICLLIWSRGPTFLSLPGCSAPDSGSGTDWYLKFSSRYKGFAGRNLGMTRHGTALWRHFQRYNLVTGSCIFCFPVSAYFVCACNSYLDRSAYHNQEKDVLTQMKEMTSLNPGSNVLSTLLWVEDRV